MHYYHCSNDSSVEILHTAWSKKRTRRLNSQKPMPQKNRCTHLLQIRALKKLPHTCQPSGYNAWQYTIGYYVMRSPFVCLHCSIYSLLVMTDVAASGFDMKHHAAWTKKIYSQYVHVIHPEVEFAICYRRAWQRKPAVRTSRKSLHWESYLTRLSLLQR